MPIGCSSLLLRGRRLTWLAVQARSFEDASANRSFAEPLIKRGSRARFPRDPLSSRSISDFSILFSFFPLKSPRNPYWYGVRLAIRPLHSVRKICQVGTDQNRKDDKQ